MPLILPGNVGSATASTSFDVANSVRYNDGDSPKMVKSSTAGNRTNWTFSAWFKRSGLGASQDIMASSDEGNNYCYLQINSDDKMRFLDYSSGNNCNKITNRLFRDTSAWMNVVLAVDTTDGTAEDRFKLYINGVRETSFATSANFTSSFATNMNVSGHSNAIGTNQTFNGQYFDGYLAEIVLVDGTTLAPTDNIGKFDSDSGIWKPINVSGLTFGNNGFYLDFEASDNLGNDANGGTDFTETNLAATDQTTDTCTNNFATLNSLINFNSGVFSEGNLAITYGDDTVSTIGLTSGRWYWEAQRTNTANEAHFGIGVSRGFFSATSVVSSGDRIYTRGGATFFSAVSNLSILTFGSNGGTSATVSNGDVMGFYLDLDSGTKNLTIKKNDGGTPIVDVDLTYTGEEPIFPFCRMNSGCSSSWNFGNPIAALSSANADANGYGSFEYNPTVGGVDFYAICTKNLAEYG